jgi:hypothetical protein
MVKGGFWLVTSLKLPLSSVKVPEVPPLMVTETAGITSLLVLLRTFPVMVDWAKAATDKKVESINAARLR